MGPFTEASTRRGTEFLCRKGRNEVTRLGLRKAARGGMVQSSDSGGRGSAHTYYGSDFGQVIQPPRPGPPPRK